MGVALDDNALIVLNTAARSLCFSYLYVLLNSICQMGKNI